MSDTAPPPSSGRANAVGRYDVTRRLVERLRPEAAVIGGIGTTNFDLWAAGPRDRNFYMLGSMGLAVPIALGVALAQPGTRVIALEGDGSILMQLGALATVAQRAPRNLGVLVMDNGCYQITGAQPTATADRADIEAIARGCGINRCATISGLDELDRELDEALAGDGPWLIVAKTDHSPPRAVTERDPVRIRMRFMDAMTGHV